MTVNEGLGYYHTSRGLGEGDLGRGRGRVIAIHSDHLENSSQKTNDKCH